MITLSELRQKQRSASSIGRKGNMKRRTTYRLLVQSEDKGRNILEMAVYGLVALSAIASIWQFAEQPLQRTGKATKHHVEARIAS